MFAHTWRLLQQHIEAKGPGWYPVAEREEGCLPTGHNQPGDRYEGRS